MSPLPMILLIPAIVVAFPSDGGWRSTYQLDIFPLEKELVNRTTSSNTTCDKPHHIYYENCTCPNDCDVIARYAIVWTRRPCFWSRKRSCHPERCLYGCQCEEDRFRDGKGNCILPEECPRPRCTGANEQYVQVPWERFMCRQSCAWRFGCDSVWLPPDFDISIYEGCLCKGGYVRDHNNTCIRHEDCPKYPPECSEPHMEFLECGPTCPSSCDFIGKPEKCMQRCVTGCYCKEGYVMDYDGHCVHPELCPKDLQEFKCGLNEDYSMCAPKCEHPCRQLGYDWMRPGNDTCEMGCSAQKHCMCKEGFCRKGSSCIEVIGRNSSMGEMTECP